MGLPGSGGTGWWTRNLWWVERAGVERWRQYRLPTARTDVKRWDRETMATAGACGTWEGTLKVRRELSVQEGWGMIQSDVSGQSSRKVPMSWRETWTLYWGPPNTSSSRAITLRMQNPKFYFCFKLWDGALHMAVCRRVKNKHHKGCQRPWQWP